MDSGRDPREGIDLCLGLIVRWLLAETHNKQLAYRIGYSTGLRLKELEIMKQGVPVGSILCQILITTKYCKWEISVFHIFVRKIFPVNNSAD